MSCHAVYARTIASLVKRLPLYTLRSTNAVRIRD